MKTIRNWLDQLKEPERTNALSNMKPSGTIEKEDCQSEALRAAFNWGHSPQGGEYWAKIFEELRSKTYYDAPQHTPEEFEGKAKASLQKAAEEAHKPSILPSDATERKEYEIYSGFFAYFPHAIAAVSRHSHNGSKQHNPDKPTMWDMDKSQDERDAMLRHMLEGDWEAVAWRAMSNLERELTNKSIYND